MRESLRVAQIHGDAWNQGQIDGIHMERIAAYAIQTGQGRAQACVRVALGDLRPQAGRYDNPFVRVAAKRNKRQQALRPRGDSHLTITLVQSEPAKELQARTLNDVPRRPRRRPRVLWCRTVRAPQFSRPRT
jgi:hypothetical protein